MEKVVRRSGQARIAVLIPTFNEGETLRKVLSSIPEHFHGRNGNFKRDIIISDDGSVDGTPDIARKFTPYVVRHETNCGVGKTTQTGLQYIAKLGGSGRYEYVLKLDGDGQHSPLYLQSVVDLLEKGNDAVIVSRFRFHPRTGQETTPLDRFLLNSAFAGLISDITGWNVTDARSGFMGFCYRDIIAIAEDIVTKRYGIPMELLLRLWLKKPNARVEEIAHPALYDLNISHKLRSKYTTETRKDRVGRFIDAFDALLALLERDEFSSVVTSHNLFHKKNGVVKSELSQEKDLFERVKEEMEWLGSSPAFHQDGNLAV